MTESVCIVQTNRSACDTYAQIAMNVLPNINAYGVVDDGLLAHIRACGGSRPPSPAACTAPTCKPGKWALPRTSYLHCRR